LIAAGVLYQHQRLTVAEQALADARRVARLRTEVGSHVGQAAALLQAGDAQGSRLHANLASEQARGEPELADLVGQAERVLAQAEEHLAAERARTEALAGLRRFEARRDDVLCYASPFAAELPASLVAAQASATAALAEFGLAPDGTGTLRLSSALTDDERRGLAASCYELLTVLADSAARRQPPDSVVAARLTQRASELRGSLAEPTAQEHFLLGIEARRRGDMSTAQREFRAAIRLQPRHVWARCFLAACYLPASPREAEAHLSVVLDQRPELYLAHLLRGIAHANLHDNQAAEADFAQALARAPAQSHAADFRYAVLATRGDWRRQRGDDAAAEHDLLAAIRLKPDAHLARLHLARAYEQAQKATDAAEQLNQALAATDLTPAIEAGILLYRVGLQTSERGSALADLERSLALHPYAEAHVELAVKRLRQRGLTSDDYEAVVEWCDYALASPAYSPETYRASRTHYLRAHALVELERYDSAAQSLDQYLAAGGRPSGEIQRLRGSIRAWHKDFPAAIHLFGESLFFEPENPATLAERGAVYLAIGAIDLAADDFRAALARDGDNASALAGRGMIRAMRGDHEGAEDDAERAWAAGPQTPRFAWMAARTLAIVHGRLQSRGRFVSVEESKSMVRYRGRVAALLEQALERTPAVERPAYWRDAIAGDVWLSLLGDQPAIRDLKQKYAPAAQRPQAL
jgi:tetratricopeptide (TPR) repeat protein